MSKLYFKLTTVPQTEDIKVDSEEFKIFKDKYIDSQGYTKDSDVIHAYYNDAGKKASFGKIHSCTIGFVHKGNIRCKVIKGKEKNILKELFTIINGHYKNETVVCFNSDFTLPFITIRSMYNTIPVTEIPFQLQHFGLKPWSLKKLKDLSAYIKGVGWFSQNFNELCFINHLEGDIINPAEVSDLIKSGNDGQVDESDVIYMKNLINLDILSEGGDIINEIICAEDKEEEAIESEALVKILETKKLGKRDANKLLKECEGLDNLEKLMVINDIGEFVKKDDKVFVFLKENLGFKDDPVLERLCKSSELTKDIETELLDMLKGAGADVGVIREILLGIWIQSDFINGNQDSKAIKEKKTEAIDNLLKQL